jgi:thiol-disulfide isomerase/thioredoxin
MVLVALALPGGAARAAEPVPLPNVTLHPLDGDEPVKLESFRGKPVLLSFWASWCGPCRWELPEFEKLYDELGGRGFVLLTVNVDTNSRAASLFLQRTGLGVPVFRLDTQTLIQLGVDSLPMSVLLDPEGNVVKAYQGYSPDVKDRIRELVLRMLDSADASGEGT